MPTASRRTCARIDATSRTPISHGSPPTISTALNLECAALDEMIALAERLRPREVTLVPERREEVTTEGGLDVVRKRHTAGTGRVERLKRVGVRSSLFIDPDPVAVRAAHDIGADAIELHTGTYSHHPGRAATPLQRCATRTILGRSLGLAVHAGHGLTVGNVGPVAAIAGIEELNIGHSIVSRAVFVGLACRRAEVRERHGSRPPPPRMSTPPALLGFFQAGSRRVPRPARPAAGRRSSQSPRWRHLPRRRAARCAAPPR